MRTPLRIQVISRIPVGLLPRAGFPVEAVRFATVRGLPFPRGVPPMAGLDSAALNVALPVAVDQEAVRPEVKRHRAVGAADLGDLLAAVKSAVVSALGGAVAEEAGAPAQPMHTPPSSERRRKVNAGARGGVDQEMLPPEQLQDGATLPVPSSGGSGVSEGVSVASIETVAVPCAPKWAFVPDGLPAAGTLVIAERASESERSEPASSSSRAMPLSESVPRAMPQGAPPPGPPPPPGGVVLPLEDDALRRERERVRLLEQRLLQVESGAREEAASLRAEALLFEAKERAVQQQRVAAVSAAALQELASMKQLQDLALREHQAQAQALVQGTTESVTAQALDAVGQERVATAIAQEQSLQIARAAEIELSAVRAELAYARQEALVAAEAARSHERTVAIAQGRANEAQHEADFSLRSVRDRVASELADAMAQERLRVSAAANEHYAAVSRRGDEVADELRSELAMVAKLADIAGVQHQEMKDLQNTLAAERRLAREHAEQQRLLYEERLCAQREESAHGRRSVSYDDRVEQFLLTPQESPRGNHGRANAPMVAAMPASEPPPPGRGTGSGRGGTPAQSELWDLRAPRASLSSSSAAPTPSGGSTQASPVPHAGRMAGVPAGLRLSAPLRRGPNDPDDDDDDDDATSDGAPSGSAWGSGPPWAAGFRARKGQCRRAQRWGPARRRRLWWRGQCPWRRLVGRERRG